MQQARLTAVDAADMMLLEPFHDFGYVLGAVAGAEQEGVVGFDQDQVVTPRRQRIFGTQKKLPEASA